MQGVIALMLLIIIINSITLGFFWYTIPLSVIGVTAGIAVYDIIFNESKEVKKLWN